MDPHFTNIVQECTAASESGRLRFPDIIARLIDAGVERYTADLCLAEKIYYRPDGTTLRVPCPNRSPPRLPNCSLLPGWKRRCARPRLAIVTTRHSAPRSPPPDASGTSSRWPVAVWPIMAARRKCMWNISPAAAEVMGAQPNGAVPPSTINGARLHAPCHLCQADRFPHSASCLCPHGPGCGSAERTCRYSGYTGCGW